MRFMQSQSIQSLLIDYLKTTGRSFQNNDATLPVNYITQSGFQLESVIGLFQDKAYTDTVAAVDFL